MPNAGAYIITFDARSAVVDRSMGNFIKELKVHNVPVFILITKSRAVTNENLLICKSNIQKGICELIGRENISIGCTETHAKSGNVDDFKEVLRKIEDRSQSLFELSSQKNISYFAGDLIVYLQSSIRKSELMPSELEGQLASVKKSMEVLSQVHSNSSNALQQQVADCASGIREELNAALTGNADYLVNGIVQNKDISDDINMICRESIINYVNNVVEPKLKSTIQKAANSLVVNIQFDVKQLDNLLNTKFYDDLGRILKDLSSGLCKFLTKELFGNEVAQGFAAGVTGLLSKGAMRSAGATAAGGALGGIIGAAVTAVAAWLIEGGMNKLKEQEIRNKTEDVVYQQIIPDAVRIASVEFQKQINLVCDQLMSKMETEIREKLNAEQKSLNDLKEKYDIEQKDKLARIENMKNELTEIEALISFNN